MDAWLCELGNAGRVCQSVVDLTANIDSPPGSSFMVMVMVP
jgi:hypothetical protein